MTTMEIQYTPNPFAGQPRDRKVVGGAEARYTDALAYVRAELKSGEWTAVNGAEIANVFKMTNTFYYLLAGMGAIERKKAKRSEFICKATPKLSTITAMDILKYNRDINQKSRERNQQKKGVTLSFAPLPITTELVDLKVSIPYPNETFLVGVVMDGRLNLNLSPKSSECKFDEYEKAIDYANNILVSPGNKIVVAKVMNVFEPVRSLQPSNL